jgi:hypothetical protein
MGRKIIKPPYFAEDAIPTPDGWSVNGEIVERRPLTWDQINNYINFISEELTDEDYPNLTVEEVFGSPEDAQNWLRVSYNKMTKNEMFETYGINKNQTKNKMIEELLNGIH